MQWQPGDELVSEPRQPETTDGVLRIDIAAWGDFQRLIHENLIAPDFIYRGQRCHDWLLLSRIDRIVELNRSAKNYDVDKLRHKLIRWQLEAFKRATRGMLGRIRETLKSDEAWWALGQHFGLATPLLDWTESPYVAAFFAFVEEPDRWNQTVNSSIRSRRAVFALSTAAFGPQPSLAKAMVSKDVSYEHYIKRVDPILDDSARLVNQAALFTEVTNGRDIAHMVRKQYKGVSERPALIEFAFPEEIRNDVIERLNVMNVNHKTLFPDLEGAAKHCNTMLGIR